MGRREREEGEEEEEEGKEEEEEGEEEEEEGEAELAVDVAVVQSVWCSLSGAGYRDWVAGVALIVHVGSCWGI